MKRSDVVSRDVRFDYSSATEIDFESMFRLRSTEKLPLQGVFSCSYDDSLYNSPPNPLSFLHKNYILTHDFKREGEQWSRNISFFAYLLW